APGLETRRRTSSGSRTATSARHEEGGERCRFLFLRPVRAAFRDEQHARSSGTALTLFGERWLDGPDQAHAQGAHERLSAEARSDDFLIRWVRGHHLGEYV